MVVGTVAHVQLEKTISNVYVHEYRIVACETLTVVLDRFRQASQIKVTICKELIFQTRIRYCSFGIMYCLLKLFMRHIISDGIVLGRSCLMNGKKKQQKQKGWGSHFPEGLRYCEFNSFFRSIGHEKKRSNLHHNNPFAS
jgi:hypothetical protein